MSKLTTKKALAYSLKELLLEKPLSKITITDITSRCGINRQTFYYHFSDITDLVEWICKEDAEKVLSNKCEYNTWEDGFLAVFELIKKDKPFILNIYHSVPLEILIRYLYKLVYPLIYKVVDEKAKNSYVTENDKIFITNFYKYAFVSIVIDWIHLDMQGDPKLIVNKVSCLVKGTIEHALNNMRFY